MVILAIETSGLNGGCALISSGQIMGETILSSGKTHSRRLMSSILSMMKELDMTWKDIEAVAVGLGPGSFTGLRIGLATAKGLALSRSLPVVGIPTLDIMAENAFIEDSRLICPLMDARRKQVYTALYEPCFPEGPRRVSSYSAVDPGLLKESVPEERHILFLGDGIKVYRTLLRDKFKKRAAFAPEFLWHPRPALAGLLASKRIKEGLKPQDPGLLVPLYCRLPEAEENKRKLKA